MTVPREAVQQLQCNSTASPNKAPVQVELS